MTVKTAAELIVEAVQMEEERAAEQQRVTIITRYYGNGGVSVVEIRPYSPHDVQGRIEQAAGYDEYSDIVDNEERVTKYLKNLRFMFTTGRIARQTTDRRG